MFKLMGGLPFARPDQHYEAPTGAIVPGARSVLTVKKITIIAGGSGGLFVYSGTPAAGNLIAAIVAANGFDGHTNATLAGIASYNTATFAAAQLNGGVVTFYSAASEAGPWTALGQIADGVWSEPAASGLNLKVGGVPAQVQITTTGVTVTVPETISVAGSAPILNVQQINATANPQILVTVAVSASQQLFWAGIIAGDTNNRLVGDVDGSGNPRLRFGHGTAAPDTALSSTAANLLSLLTADFDVATAGRGLRVAEGSNAKQGTATLVAGAVTVANTSVTANSRIMLTAQNLGTVTVPSALCVSARVAGTSFTIKASQATDTSLVAYEIFEPG